MKKTTTLLAVAAIIAGCSTNDEIGDISGGKGRDAIIFSEAFIQKETTRASGDILTKTDLQNNEIAIWGEKYTYEVGAKNYFTANNSTYEFEGDKLLFSSPDWVYEGTHNWDKDLTYDFSAFVPYEAVTNENGEPTGNVVYTEKTAGQGRVFEVKNVSLVSKTLEGNDYLISRAKDVNGNFTGVHDKVPLSFSHILSKLNVYVYTDVAEYSDGKGNDEGYIGREIKLTKMSLYLPSSSLTATYTEAAHDNTTRGSWEWGAGFNNQNKTTIENISEANDRVSTLTNAGYQEYIIADTDPENPINADYDVSYQATAADAKENIGKPEGVSILGSFFITPSAVTDNATVNPTTGEATYETQEVTNLTPTVNDYYMTVEYDVVNSDNDSKVLEHKSSKIVHIDGLQTFRQGHRYNLLVCLSKASDFNPIKVSVETLVGWEEDNIDNSPKPNPSGSITIQAPVDLPAGTKIEADIDGKTYTAKLSRKFTTGSTLSNLDLIDYGASTPTELPRTRATAGTDAYVKVLLPDDGDEYHWKGVEYNTDTNGLYKINISGNQHYMVLVQLGLSVKWADRNIGATSPAEYGDYYAWGEVNTSANNIYSSCDANNKSIQELIEAGIIDSDTHNLTIGHDVGYQKTNGKLRMPTKAESDELKNLTIETATINNIEGSLVTGKNGKSIFVPYAGNRSYSSQEGKGSCSCFWTCTPSENKSSMAYWFTISTNYSSTQNAVFVGLTVRPVSK